MLNDVNFFRKYANAEVLGSEPARRFSEMADFLETFHLDALSYLVSTTYSEGYGIQVLRGFYSIIDEMVKEEIQISECHDLHTIAMTPMAMEYFIDWVKEQNEFYFFFYNGLFLWFGEKTSCPNGLTGRKWENMKEERIESEATHKEDIKKFKEKSSLNSLYGISEEVSAVDQFERLTGTLYKSLFKAIGLEKTRKIHFIISNNMVFFNYNGIQYKYYPSQCKLFKKRARKYQRINWKNFAEENNLDGQKQKRGRSPPFTPDIRSTTINDLK